MIPPLPITISRRSVSQRTLRAIVAWFIETRYRVEHRRGVLPFYCDPERIGAFAVDPKKLAAGDDAAIFQLLITLSMYQALRDVVIMRRQRLTTRRAVRGIAEVSFLKRRIATHPCPTLVSPEAFETGCNVAKRSGVVDCDRHAGVACHVKDATTTFHRVGDMGKLPTSAWLRLWKNGGARQLLSDVCRDEPSPAKRAALLVGRVSQVHRVGRKLATLFVSALSTPALAPGLTPWFPAVDGNDLIVIDTNVARAVDRLRRHGSARTYEARERWLRRQAARLDLSDLHPTLPDYSPRIVQEALYAFGSKSNRQARGDTCIAREKEGACEGCVAWLCPLHGSQSVTAR